MRRILFFTFPERQDDQEHDRQRGERVPLERVRLVLLRAGIGPRPVAQQAIAGVGMLLDDERMQAEPGLLRELGNLRSEEHTSELQSLRHLVCRLLLEKKKK